MGVGKEAGGFCRNTDYPTDQNGDMDKIKSMSGTQRQEHSYEGQSGFTDPNRLPLADALKAQAFCAHFHKAPLDIAKEEKNPHRRAGNCTWGN